MGFREKSQKQLQVGEQVKRQIAHIFLREDIFNGSFKVTVCEADASPDLKNVKIFVNIFGEVDNEAVLKELNNHNYFFQKKLSKSLRLRNVPNVKFILDSSAKSAIDIESKINEESKNYSDSFNI